MMDKKECRRTLASIINPEDVYDKCMRKDHEIISKYLDELYEDCDIQKIKTLYFNYEFFENQLMSFVEADSCAYDKTRWLLKQYLEELAGGCPEQIPDGCCEVRRHYHPEFGAIEDWLRYIEVIDDLYRNGPTEKNLRGIKKMQLLHDEYLNR